MSLQEDLEDLAREEFSEYTQNEAEYQEKIINKVLDAAVSAGNEARNAKGFHGSDLAAYRHGCTEVLKAINKLREGNE